jgi:hypothetical protein
VINTPAVIIASLNDRQRAYLLAAYAEDRRRSSAWGTRRSAGESAINAHGASARRRLKVDTPGGPTGWAPPLVANTGQRDDEQLSAQKFLVADTAEARCLLVEYQRSCGVEGNGFYLVVALWRRISHKDWGGAGRVSLSW